MFTRVILLFLCLLSVVTFASEAQAKKSFWDAMFGWAKPVDNTPDPSQTLQAPFAYEGDAATPEGAIEHSAKNTVPLKHAHTNEAVVGKWLIEGVSESLSYDVSKKEDIYEKNKHYFAPSGLAQFKKFMADNNIQKVMDSGKFNIRSFVKEDPLLLNSATAENRFRWLFEVPVMVSYMDAADFNYKEDDPVNQHIVLTIQVGRVPEADNELGVLIETWSGKSQKIDKN